MLKLYFDFLTQPSRALYILLKFSNFEFEPKYVSLRKADNYSEEFTKINSLQKVPVIDHNGFILTESVAIMKYLSREGIISENLYPKDSKRRARVDEFLEWQHLGLRSPCAMYFRRKVFLPAMSKQPPPTLEQIAALERHMVAALEVFSDKWLGRGTKFVAGDKITLADLLAACEIEQPRMSDFEPREKFKTIAQWIEKVREHFNPYYDECHHSLNMIAEKKEPFMQ